jgi:hypothetical protein
MDLSSSPFYLLNLALLVAGEIPSVATTFVSFVGELLSTVGTFLSIAAWARKL